jgi:hypothetical protein
MSDGGRSALVRLIAALINRHRDADPVALAETVISELEAAGLPAARAAVHRREARFRPHVWPQNPESMDRRLHCLSCGAAFGSQRAEGPCEGHQQGSCVPPP